MRTLLTFVICMLSVSTVVYADGPSLGGPDGVAQRLAKDEEPEASFKRVSVLQPYFDWKADLKKKTGLTFGLSGIFLYQGSDETLPDTDDTAFGGIFRFNGSWVLLGRDTGHPGRIEWRVENRQNLGGEVAPQTLGGNVGAAALNSGFAYSEEFNTNLAVFNWTQVFNDNSAGIAAGRMAFDVYLDPYAFQTFSRAFINRAFVVNPTLATTGIGALGAVGKGFEYKVRDDQHLALAAGWANLTDPADGPAYRDEYVIETSYRVQISPSVSLTPDLQLLFDPAKNPDTDTVWIAGIRCIVNL